MPPEELDEELLELDDELLEAPASEDAVPDEQPAWMKLAQSSKPDALKHTR